MAVPGVFMSDSGIQGNRRGDFASALLQVMPTGSAGLLALSAGMPSQDARDTIVTWFEENHLSGRARVTPSGTINSTTTSLAVVDASFLTAGAILLVESTGEYLFVSAISGNTLTIARGFGDSTAATIANDAYLQKIGTAFEENSSRPRAVANLGFPRFNYCQIFRNAWNVSGTTMAVDYHTGDQVAKSKADASMQHAEDIERSILFGKKQITSLNSAPFRATDGVLSQITTNVVTETGNTTWDDLDSFLRDIFERNIKGKPNERVAWCGNGVVQVLNKIARIEGALNINVAQTEFGLQIMRWLTPYGNISLLTHPLLVENPTWTKNLYVLHPGAVRTRWLRRTFFDDYDRSGTRAGVDGDYGVITSELAIEYHAERTGGKFEGMATAA